MIYSLYIFRTICHESTVSTYDIHLNRNQMSKSKTLNQQLLSDDHDDTNWKKQEVLSASVHYVQKLIYVLQFGSVISRNFFVLVGPVYVTASLNLSEAMLGVVLFAIAVVQFAGALLTPVLGRYVSFDIN
eukprot:389812_1